MPKETDQNSEWLSSVEARKKLRISSCELMHVRVAGQLQFKKQGNAYIYAARDLNILAHKVRR